MSAPGPIPGAHAEVLSAKGRPVNPHPVADLERQRCEALVAGDIDRVASLLGAGLVYVHAPGVVHDRDALLDFLRTQVRFDALERRGLQVHGDDAFAWTTGWLRLEGARQPGGERVAGVSFVSQVWRRSPQGWQMVLFQSTRVDEAQWVATGG